MKADMKGMIGAIVAGGLVAGAFDAITAIAGHVAKHQGVLDTFRYIASGLIGMTAFNGEVWTELLGVLVHFGLTTIMATGFVLLAARKRQLWQNPLPAGVLYGMLVYLLMYYVIVPHTGAPHFKQPSGFWANLSTGLGHGCFVGLPIALMAQRYFAGRPVPALAR